MKSIAVIIRTALFVKSGCSKEEAMTNAVKEIVQHKKLVEEVLNSMQKGLEEKLDAEREKENKKIFIVMDEIKKVIECLVQFDNSFFVWKQRRKM
ncbi:hypothetical protein BBG47_28125 [Paenibacillus sp. KS1]|uniref:hypothetical protein n=2 Tax=unclassified Paenibacillus TaxID=185978 RepID=UPI000806476B|nr:hypothetical protein [Paenibacillus sp. KS1]OBY76285.1 hypothetical protein BBG47_28125 [Paenibacillus sp. KS1]